MRAPAVYDFNQNWLFGGAYVAGSAALDYSDIRFAKITLPHTVTPLSWGGWDPSSWESVWIYRKHLDCSGLPKGRVFIDFDGVMTTATMFLGGVEIAQHIGGYLPWSVELTPHLVTGQNVLAVAVDARWLNVPPDGNAGGPSSIDYLEPGGIYRDVALRVVPNVFIADVFATPRDVLTADPSVDITVVIDAAIVPSKPLSVRADLLDGSQVIASKTCTTAITETGLAIARMNITALRDIVLWSPDAPKLYAIRATLAGSGVQPHSLQVRTGFREATFRLNGFWLNGERLQIFGLNRHELFPYLGMAASRRLQRRDAELLKLELNCNMVRCSHYPQSPHFLDACDELGLMVWEEPPGWRYVGDEAFQDIVLQNVTDMVIRDRNRPSVIVWGTRLNETRDHTMLYDQTRRLVNTLDGSRQTTGAMDLYSTEDWAEDVFAYDDYNPGNRNGTLKPPIPGVPYMVSEAVGALDGAPLYRWIDNNQTLALQARLHAKVHNIARSNPAYAGLLGWAGIDYASLSGGNRVWQNVKWPGVLDTFRVPKPGAAFYRSQLDPAEEPIILPVFFWDFGPNSPPNGPGLGAMIATNCERLELYVDSRHLATASPDVKDYGNLAFPPVFVDLFADGSTLPELEIHGYVHDARVTRLRMSADPACDQLALVLEDCAIEADGSDMTRFTFRALDVYGNQRPGVSGDVDPVAVGPRDSDR